MCVDKHNFSNKNYNMKQYVDLNNYLVLNYFHVFVLLQFEI